MTVAEVTGSSESCTAACTLRSIKTESDATCDGIDDDCSGTPDEDYVPAACGVGACARASRCLGGEEVLCTQGSPAVETCNGVDDNCDGNADEGFAGKACDGEDGDSCALGTVRCDAGGSHCDGDLAPPGNGDLDFEGVSNGDELAGVTDPCASDAPLGPAGFRLGPAAGHAGSGGDVYRSIALDHEQRLVVSGWARSTLGTLRGMVLRFLGDGTLDPTFADGGVWMTTAMEGRNVWLRAVAVDSAGNILVAGAQEQGYDVIPVLLRLDPDGALDDGYGAAGSATGMPQHGFYARAHHAKNGTDCNWPLADTKNHFVALAIDAQDRAVVVGASSYRHIVAENALMARFGADGSLDVEGFNATDARCAGGMRGFHMNGRDAWLSFGTTSSGDDSFRDVAIEPSGRILAVGPANGATDGLIAAFDAGGDLDPSFLYGLRYRIDVVGNSASEPYYRVAIAPAGVPIYAVGFHSREYRALVAQFDQTGYFGSATVPIAADVYGTAVEGGPEKGLFSLAFKVPLYDPGYQISQAAAVDSAGRLVLAIQRGYGGGTAPYASGTIWLARLLKSGAMDSTFGIAGHTTIPTPGQSPYGGGEKDQIWDMAIDARGRIVAVGESAERGLLLRFGSDGLPDKD
jgi:uncharacterized delta-60 repeat protein